MKALFRSLTLVIIGTYITINCLVEVHAAGAHPPPQPTPQPQPQPPPPPTPTPAPTPAPVDPHACLKTESLKNDPVLARYADYIVKTPNIRNVLGFCQKTSVLQSRIWSKIRSAEQSGLAPVAGLPESYNSPDKGAGLTLTESEAFWIYAAKIAHALWLEMNSIVPWKLSTYSKTDVEKILLTDPSFTQFDTAQKKYAVSLLLDYSPRETYSLSLEILGGTVPSANSTEVLGKLIRRIRTYRHGGNNDAKSIISIKGMNTEKISRHGCQTTAFFIVALAQSLNIPGAAIRGYFDGAAHRTAIFQKANRVLSHGDDPYNALLKNTSSLELMDSYTFWKDNVLAYPPGDSRGAHNSNVHNKLMAIKYPAKYLMNAYCTEGMEYLHTTFDTWASEETLENLADQIEGLTNHCTMIPENTPNL